MTYGLFGDEALDGGEEEEGNGSQAEGDEESYPCSLVVGPAFVVLLWERGNGRVKQKLASGRGRLSIGQYRGSG